MNYKLFAMLVIASAGIIGASVYSIDNVYAVDKTNITEEKYDPNHYVTIIPGASKPDCNKQEDCYNPAEMTLPYGSTVVWTNKDSALHTVVFDDSGIKGTLPPGLTYTVKFEESGEFSYHCAIHNWMDGRITIK